MSSRPKKWIPKLSEASETMKTPKRSILASRVRHTPSSAGRVKFSLDNPDNSRLNRSRMNNESINPIPRPLLGYDWIAGVVEMDSLPTSSGRGVNISQDFLDEMDEFRKTNREECARKVETPGKQHFTPIKPRKMYPTSPDPADTRDSRILDFTVNSRLYPVPIDSNIVIRPGTNTSPRFIRISVPKSVLSTPNKFKRSIPKFTNSDSMAILDHCMLGREYALPSKNRIPIPKLTSNLDLRASLLPDPSKRVRDVGALHSTILSMPPSMSGSYRDPRSCFN